MMPIQEYRELTATTMAEFGRLAMDAPTADECVMHRAALLQMCLKMVGMLCVGMTPEAKVGVLGVLMKYFDTLDQDYLQWSAEISAAAAIKEAAR